MCRVVTMILRIAWANRQHNVSLAMAANIFVQAGTVLLYIINLVFALRVIRAQHPRLGWHRSLSIAARVLIAVVVLTLIALIASVIQESYTLNANAHRIDKDIQLYGTTFYAFVAFLPIPMLIAGIIIPRRIRTEKFGKGRFRYKIAILATASALCTIRASYACGIAWLKPIPLESPIHPWQLSKEAFYTFCFVPEIAVVVLYAAVRVDLRFAVPAGQRGTYMAAPSDAGGVYSVPEAAQSEVLKIYSEEELFDDSATLADTLRYSQTSLILDADSGKWALKRLSTQSLYSRDSTSASLLEGRDSWAQGGMSARNSLAPSHMSARDSLTPSRLSARDSFVPPSRLSGMGSIAESSWSYV
jgi:hypothetical protein